MDAFREAENTRLGFVDAGQDFKLLSALGVRWDRPHPGPFNWAFVEPAYDRSYDWRGIDQYIDIAQYYGFATVATIWPFHYYDQMVCHSALPPAQGFVFRQLPRWLYKPCNTDAYRAFVQAMVERYDGDGVNDYPNLKYPIKYWEAANEPEMNGPGLTFFLGTPQDYAEILRATYQAVKAADPTAKVLQGGSAGLVDQRMYSFWETLFSIPDIGSYLDIANVHSISSSPTLFVPDFMALLRAHGLGAKPLWVTEASVSTDPTPASQGRRLTEEGKGQLLRQSFRAALAAGAAKIFYTALYGYGDPQMAKEALLRPDGTRLPAYDAFVAMIGEAAAIAPAATPTPATASQPLMGWAFEGQVMTGAVDASVILLPDGTYRMYYATWREWPIGEHQRGPFIASAVSSDGLRWRDEGDRGLSGGWPRVTRLPDGRLRMYYGGWPGIAAAVSADGLNWQPEALSGLEPSQAGVREYGGVDVLRLPDSSYRLYYSETVPSAQFTVTGITRILSAISRDGLNWQREAGLRIEPQADLEGPAAYHPRVIRLADGTYKMFYGTTTNNIWSATSQDGLSWTDRRAENVFGTDPEVVALPDGRLRLYTNYLDSTFRTGRERQQMWSSVWGEVPYDLQTAGRLRLRQGQSGSVAVEVRGRAGRSVSLSPAVYDYSAPTNPIEAAITPISGAVPFTAYLRVTTRPTTTSATIVVTGDDGSTRIRTVIAVGTVP